MTATLSCSICHQPFKAHGRRAMTAKYCSVGCHAVDQRRPPSDRLREKLKRNGACLIYTGDTDENGYGRVWDRTKKCHYVYAHRLSYGLKVGLSEAPSDDVIVRHSCDNPPCCEWDHLLGGTQIENTADRDSKHRVRHGSRHASAKLTEETVRKARILYATGEVSQRALARIYRVAPATMADALNGDSWKRA